MRIYSQSVLEPEEWIVPFVMHYSCQFVTPFQVF